MLVANSWGVPTSVTRRVYFESDAGMTCRPTYVDDASFGQTFLGPADVGDFAPIDVTLTGQQYYDHWTHWWEAAAMGSPAAATVVSSQAASSLVAYSHVIDLAATNNGPRQVQETADVLKEHGIDPRGDDDLSALAQRIRSSPIAFDLITALDEWRSHAGADRARLARLLDEADDDPWRARLRSESTVEGLRDLARDAEVGTMPVQALTALANRLGNAGDVAGAVALARRGQALHPGDFWANYTAALWSDESTPKRLDDVVRYYTAAIALRPRSFAAYNNLGVALREKGDLDGAAIRTRVDNQTSPARSACLPSIRSGQFGWSWYGYSWPARCVSGTGLASRLLHPPHVFAPTLG